jgi:hypothetical protein
MDYKPIINMQAMKNILKSSVLLLLVTSLCGCGSKNDSFGQKIRNQGNKTVEIAKDWETGESMKKEGTNLIHRGKNKIKEGESIISEGRDAVVKGEKLVSEGILLQEKSNASYQDHMKEVGVQMDSLQRQDATNAVPTEIAPSASDHDAIAIANK